MINNVPFTLNIRIFKVSAVYSIDADTSTVLLTNLPFDWFPNSYDLETIQLLSKDPKKVAQDQLISLGQDLYKAVFVPEILNLYFQLQKKVKKGNGIRIRLIVEPPELSLFSTRIHEEKLGSGSRTLRIE